MRQVTLPIMRLVKGGTTYKNAAIIASIVLDYVQFTDEAARDHWTDGVGSILHQLLLECAKLLFLPHCPEWIHWANKLYIKKGKEDAIKEVPDVAPLNLDSLTSWTGVMPFVDEPEAMYSARVDQASSYSFKLNDAIRRTSSSWMQEGLSTFSISGANLTADQARRILQAGGTPRLEGETSAEYIARGINPAMIYPVVDEQLHRDWIQFLFVR